MIKKEVAPILNDEEIKEAKVGHVAILVNGKPEIWDSDRALAKAQRDDTLKWVVEWGDKECPHADVFIGCGDRRRECPKCWQELKVE